MKRLNIIDLGLIFGGDDIVPIDECAALQNEINLEGDDWKDEDFDIWIKKMIDAGCYHYEVTP